MASDPIERLQNIDEYEFEKFVADLWEKQGWSTEVTTGSGDRGVDVIATRESPFPEKQIIQAKCYSKDSKVGGPDIQQYASLRQQEQNVDAVIVITTGRFTKDAQRTAEELNVKLIDVDGIERIIDEQNAHDVVRTYVSIKKSDDQEWLTDEKIDESRLDQYVLFSLLDDRCVLEDHVGSIDFGALAKLGDTAGIDPESVPAKELVDKLRNQSEIIQGPRRPTQLDICPSCGSDRCTAPIGFELRINGRRIRVVESSKICHSIIWYNSENMAEDEWKTSLRTFEEDTAPLDLWQNIKFVKQDGELRWLRPNPFNRKRTFDIVPSTSGSDCPECENQDSIWAAKTAEDELLVKCESCKSLWKLHKNLLRKNRLEYIECPDEERIGEKLIVSDFNGLL